MDRWRRWRTGRAAGRAGARRAEVTLAVLVTAAVSELLAVVFHRDVVAAVAAVAGGLPALYLAWLAVPGVMSRPRAARW